MILPPFIQEEVDSGRVLCDTCLIPAPPESVHGVGHVRLRGGPPVMVTPLLIWICPGCHRTLAHPCREVLTGLEYCRQVLRLLRVNPRCLVITPSIRPGTPPSRITDEDVRRFREQEEGEDG